MAHDDDVTPQYRIPLTEPPHQYRWVFTFYPKSRGQPIQVIDADRSRALHKAAVVFKDINPDIYTSAELRQEFLTVSD